MATTETASRHGLVQSLRSVMAGPVLTDGQPGYDLARTPYFEHWLGHPLAVIRPVDARDVAATIDIARSSGIELAIRGGGHSSHSTGDGLLLDLSDLEGIDLDVPAREVWAGAGLTAGDLTRALSPHGLAVGFGDTGSVGIGGLTLGGGIGFLSRRDGLTIDNLLAAEIVTADGQIRTADANRDPELFWAIRGGGGNFGVATRFRYRLTPTGQVYAGILLLPATPQSITHLAAALTHADDTLTGIVDIMPAPPVPDLPPSINGDLVAMVRACYSGEPEGAVDALAPIRAVSPAHIDLLRPMPYAALFDVEAPSRGTQVAVRTLYVDCIDATKAAAALEQLSQPGPKMRMVQFRVLGGAVGRVPAEATAYAHRGRPIMVTIVHEGTQDRPTALDWTNALAARLSGGHAGAYVGFIGPDDAHRADAAYPEPVLTKLRRIKSAYDPANLFRKNINIRP